jgi:nucleoside-diphosphate-sugar epimerase
VSAPLAVVTGASGFVGSHIVDELVAQGARVRCLLRPSSSTRWLDESKVEIARVPLDRVEPLVEAIQGATWIVHAAGLTKARSPKEFHEANVNATERMLRAAMQARSSLQRFLLVSSQSVAGPAGPDGRPVTEGERPDPASAYGVSKLRAEELTLLLKDSLPVTVIRPPAVYGPRDTAIYRVFTAVKRHVLPVLKTGGRFTLVHAEDLARAVHLALVDSRAAGQVYFVGEPDITDYVEVGAQVCRALGTWAYTISPPAFLLGTGALVAEAWGAVTRTAPLLTREKVREIRAGDWICSSAKIRTQLGWEPRLSLEEGIRRTADWYRQAGWV